MNIALGIEYSGTHYCGWQRQSHSPSVQQTLEEVLSKIAGHPVLVNCAGRTDSGVHATGQVVNYELKTQRPLKAWHMGANTWLPDDISIRWAKQVPDDFHARHSALLRRYRYIILNSHYPSATIVNKVTWYKRLLDAEKMHQGAQALLGENNFASFQASSCQSQTSFRFIKEISVKRWLDFVIVDVCANAFLHHMVRNIVGCLLEVGSGNQSVNFVAETLNKQDRTQAPATAKPDGLYLVKVFYPQAYDLPDLPMGPFLLPDNLN